MTTEEIISKFLTPAMLVVFIGMLVFFGVVSVVLNYHWTQYGVDQKRLAQIRKIYWSVSVFLLLTLAGIFIGTLL